MLLFSSLITISSSSWLMIWVFMEINSLAMCSMISKEMKKENESNNQSLIYLVVQLTSSIILLFSINSANTSPIFLMITMFCLMIKSGVWPFHLWYLKTLSLMKTKHKTMMTVMTWQKVIPMLLLPHLVIKPVLFLVALICLVTPALKLKKTTSFKTVMISSSLNNNAWLILCSIVSSIYFLLYLMIYSISLFLTLNFFKTLKTKNSFNTKKFWESMIILANMGGVPPMLMFTGKLLLFSILIQTQTPKEILLLMMMMACLFMYHYMWSTSSFLMKMPTKTQLWKKSKNFIPQVILMLTTPLTLFILLLGFT